MQRQTHLYTVRLPPWLADRLTALATERITVGGWSRGQVLREAIYRGLRALERDRRKGTLVKWPETDSLTGEDGTIRKTGP